MQIHQSTGWRKLRPALLNAPVFQETTREELYECARLAAYALRLRPALRQVLEQLVGCYRETPVAGRLLVWPSNEFLVERTGLSERSVRYAIAGLISEGILSARDSANGKRFAVRAKSGQIVDAYGLDLSPLLARQQALRNKAEEIRAETERRRRIFDEITILRRAVNEIALSLGEWDAPSADLERRAADLAARTPRRSASAVPDLAATHWRELHEYAQQLYRTACAGKNCRQIEDNNESPDQSCNKRQGMNADRNAGVSLIDLATACPDSLGYAEPIASERDLVGSAGRLRGAMGVHVSAWEEACEKLGPVMAGATFFVVLQIYDADQKGVPRIKNFGGYFRAYARRVADGLIDLPAEIRAMRSRRAH